MRADAPVPVTIYYNRACADCLRYIEETIVPLLRQAGYTDLTYKDYINQPANRTELLARSDELGVPPDLQSHLTVFVDDRIVLEGHIPEHVVADLLAAPTDAFERIVVYRDKMSSALQPGVRATAAHHPGRRRQPARHAPHPAGGAVEPTLGALGRRAGDDHNGSCHLGVVCVAAEHRHGQPGD